MVGRGAGPEGKRVETFDDLIVCSGHHRDPLMPEYPGTFSGRTLHSREYKRPEPFEDERVLVVGGGNSACDIAVDMSRVARSVSLSMREGYYILPKIMLGRPDRPALRACANVWFRYSPRFVFEAVARAIVRLEVGPWKKYGLQTPKGSPTRCIRPSIPQSSPHFATARYARVRHRALRRQGRPFQRRLIGHVRHDHLGDRLPYRLPLPRCMRSSRRTSPAPRRSISP